MKQDLFTPSLLRVATLAAALCAAAPVLRAQFTGSTGFDYTTGKYGESSSTNILYIPLIGEYPVNGWTLKLIVPYIRVSGLGNVVRDIGLLRVTPRPTSATESGLGDIVASAGCDFYRDEGNGLTLGATGRIKFGTASSRRGLGTGENDFYLQTDLSRPFGDWLPFATLGYRILGDPPGASLRNGFYSSFGATCRIDAFTKVGGALDVREKVTRNGDGAAELSAFVARKVDRNWRVLGYLLTGLTDGSPDFGGGGLLSYSF